MSLSCAASNVVARWRANLFRRTTTKRGGSSFVSARRDYDADDDDDARRRRQQPPEDQRGIRQRRPTPQRRPERGFGAERKRLERFDTNPYERALGRGFSSSGYGEDVGDGDEERVSKILARRGTCSRREAERLIADGLVFVDGVRVREQGFKCSPTRAKIEISREAEAWLGSKLTLVVHKPPGLVSNLPSEGEIAAWTCVEPRNAWMRAMEGMPMEDLKRATKDPSKFNVCGRLDKDSRGMLILTEDGALARSIIGGNGVLKRYVVTTDADVRESHMASLNGRVQLEGVELLPMNVRRLGRGSRTLEFNLREGKNRQIRRVCEKFGLRVVDLFRVQIGSIEIDDLPEGAWRILSDAEVKSLRELEFDD